MKKLISSLAIAGVLTTAVFLTGCGGDDDHNDNGGTPTTAFAPASLTNKTVTLTENGQSRTLTFAATGDNYTQFETGTTNAVGTGTYQYTRQGDNNSQLVLMSTDPTTGVSSQVTYNMTFTSASTGTYTFTTSGGQTGSGTFANLQDTSNNGGNNNGGNNNGGNNNGGNTGTAPASLAGKIIDFTATNSGNERLTFGTNGTVTSDAVTGTANYTYTAGAQGTPSTLVVNFPNGDVYDLTMNFQDNATGSWSGNQHFDGADHPVPAGSSFTIQNP